MPTLYRCDYCMKVNESMKTCGKCRNIRYCSNECQKEDWAKHKMSCGDTLPKSKEGKIYTGNDHLNSYRKTHKEQWSHITEPHCMICGDVDSECPLVRTACGILCKECEQIQLNM